MTTCTCIHYHSLLLFLHIPPSLGVFPPLWYDHVADIASKSPLLIVSGAEKYLDKELELNHPLKKGDITVVSISTHCLRLLYELAQTFHIV